MKTFAHSGRFGDLFYALWTMRELGGGKLILNDFHTPNWSLEHAWTLNNFLLYQSFIESVEYVPYAKMPKVDYDLHEAENDFNPEAFTECEEYSKLDFAGEPLDVPWNGIWPGSANIAKRYAVHFGLTYRPGETWLEAPNPSHPELDLTIHVPERRSVRKYGDWGKILNQLRDYSFCIIGDSYHGDWLDTASNIKLSKAYLGAVSGSHALAEGLGKTRFVEQAPDCFNVSVLPPSQCINDWSCDKVVEEVRKFL